MKFWTSKSLTSFCCKLFASGKDNNYVQNINFSYQNRESMNRKSLKHRPLFIVAVVSLIGIVAFQVFRSGIMNQNNNLMKIEVGSKIPSFALLDQDGNLFDINEIVGKKNLVIYFYPKDDTPGCTKEACSFRDQFEVFRDAGAEVIGISSDSVKSHKNFALKHRLQFQLLSDVDKTVRKAFGVPTDFLGLLPGRVTYIVDKAGVVQNVFNSQFNADKHVEEALRVLKNLEKK
jgi:peroxiredoxin Q/BCP